LNDLVGLSKIVCTHMNVDTMLKDSQTPRYAQRHTHRTYKGRAGGLVPEAWCIDCGGVKFRAKRH